MLIIQDTLVNQMAQSKEKRRTLDKSLPDNHAQFQQSTKILKMIFEALNNVKGTKAFCST